MKAIVQFKYGQEDTLSLKEVIFNPSLLSHQILIKIHAANISSGDKNINTLALKFPLNLLIQLVFGVGKPRASIRGISGAGEVIEVGSKVTRFKPGQRVNFINSMKASVMAEYLTLDEKSIVASFDKNIEYKDAAPIAFGAMTAFHFINNKTVKKDDKILVYGASGSVGSYAVSLAAYYQGQVTAIASKKHHPALAVLPFKNIIDYQTHPLETMKGTYDIIFDAVGKLTKKDVKHLSSMKTKFFSVKSMTKEDTQRLVQLNALLKNKNIVTIIDQVYPLAQFKEAHRHVYQGHKTGNIILSMMVE